MATDVVTVKNQKPGFFANLSSSFGGIIIGILMLIGGISLLWWNEHNNVRNIKNVKELRDQVVDVSSTEVKSENEGKLIATNGKLDYNDATVTDTEFSISFKTPVFCREVEIYQWVEESETKDDTTTYTYKKEWKSELVDSDDFNTSAGHVNPKEADIKYFSDRFSTDEDLKVGAFTLDDGFKNIISSDKSVNIPEDAVMPEGYTIYNSRYITDATDMSNPEVGNIRIHYTINDYKDVSVLGKQIGDTIGDYTTKTNTNVKKIVKGTTNGAGMINDIESANKFSKWMFRFLGTLLIVLGVGAILGPITTLIGYIPFLGNVVNSVIGVISFLIGLGIALVVIAISWFAARPIVAICSLVGVAVIIILLVTFIKKGKKEPVKVEEKTK